MPRRAIIVAGHAILKPLAADPATDDAWTLLPFQTGEAACFVEHVRRGVALAARDPEALLVFSGGQSRADAGPRSEAESYRDVAAHYAWWGHTEVAARTALEVYARDSFENLLFGLLRFQQLTGAWPEHVTLVSWKFKQQRFELHRDAMGWPAAGFTFDGPNDPPQRDQALAAEARTLAAYQRDPYSESPEFQAKKAARNPFHRTAPYAQAAERLRRKLPWR